MTENGDRDQWIKMSSPALERMQAQIAAMLEQYQPSRKPSRIN